MKSPARINPQRTLWEKTFFVVVTRFFFILLALCLFLSITEKSFATNGINRVINFQGKIVNKSDSTNITNGTYSFTFKIYDAATSGNLLWQETQSSVTVTNGIFQVSLGSITPFNGGGYNVNFNQNNLYLDITFNSETFGSRIQLSAVPYAVNSEQLDGVIATQSATGFNLSGGMSSTSVASFTTSGSTLTFQPGVAEALTIQSSGANALTLDTGSGATLNIANTNATTVQFGGSQNPTYTFSGTGSFTTSSGLNTLGGNVQVNGSTISLANASSSTIQTTGTNTGLSLLSNGSGNITLGQNLGNGNVVVTPNAGGQAALMVEDWGNGDLFTASSSGTPQFVITHSGALGIGTTTPHTGMEISKTGTIGTYDYEMLMNPPSGFGARFAFTSNSNSKAVLMGETSAGNGDFSIKTASNANWSAGSATWNERFTISNAGVVDIPNLATNGVVFTSSGNGTLNSAATLATSMGGLGANITAAGAGELLYSTGTTAYGHLTAALSSNLCLLSGGAAAPSWSTCPNYWQRVTDTSSNYTVLSPATITDTFSLGVTGSGTNVVPFSSFYMEPPLDTKGNAMVALNQTSLGPIFTASASGSTKFVINQNGNVGIGTGMPSGSLDIESTASNDLVLNNNNANNSWINFENNGSSIWQQYLNGNNMLLYDQVTARDEFQFQSGGSFGIGPKNNGTLHATLDVRENSYSTPVASLSGATGKATLVLDNSGAGDLFTASTSGFTRFVIHADGSINTTAISTNPGLTVSNTGGGNTLSLTGISGTVYFDKYGNLFNNGEFTANNATGLCLTGCGSNTFQTGGTSILGTYSSTTALATLDVRSTLGTLTTASISGSTALAGFVVDNSGTGDIFTASSSGLSRFSIQQNGAIIIGADGTPIATTLRGGAATGSNVAGANLTLDASNGTGSGGSGDLIFRTAAGSGSLQTITQDAVSTVQHNAGTTSLTWSHTVGSQSNRILLVGFSTYQTGASSVTYGGVNLTKIATSANTGNQAYSEVWYLKNPASGTASVVINLSASSAIVADSVSYYNVNQTTPFGTAATNSGTSVTATTTVSSTNTNQLVFDNFAFPANVGGWTPNQTQLWSNATSNGGAASSETATASTTNVIWTNSSTGEQWADVAVPLNPSSSANSTADTLTDRLHITGSGNVGIGTATPHANLDVAGTNTLFETGIVASVGSGASGNGSNAVINAVGDQGSMIPNAGFESDQLGGFADGWFATSTNSATISRDTSTQAKGNVSLKVALNSAATAIYSTCIPVAGTAGSYTLNYYVKGTSPFPDVIAYMDGYTSESNCQSDTTNKPTAPQPAVVTTAWTKKGTNTTAVGIPSNQTWGRVHFLIACPATGSCSGATVELDGVRLTESTTGQGLDYAENYPTDPHNIPQPGQVVSLATALDGSAAVVPATKPMDTAVIGVVSTNPGEVLDDGTMTNPVPVALAGRAPTNVSTENGPIHLGDYLTSSDIPGVAVKATKAGQVIGVAMEDDTDTNQNDVKQVVMFVKNTYFAGDSTNQGVTDAFSELGTLEQKAETTNTTNLSVTNTDRLVAGLDVITPKLVADSVFTNTISASSGQDVMVALNNGSLILKNNAGNSVMQFDDQGNASIKGMLTADTIQANHIKGLDIIANQITQLSSQVSSLSANMSVLGAETIATDTATPVATISSTSLDGLTVNGLATVSGDLRIKGNALFENMLSVIDTLSANNFIVNGMSDFFSTVVFHGRVQFAQPPVFSTDTAGNITINKGQDQVAVTFANAYQTAPIVTANIANNDQATSQTILANGYTLVVTNITNKGFTVLLNKAAQQDITVSWIAVAVQNGQVFSLPTPTPVLDENTNPATGSATP